MTKRVFDIAFSLLATVFSLPIVAVAWVTASLDTRSNGLFIQQRVGLHGRMFNLYKIKTMRDDLSYKTCITTSNDPRITRSGRLLRRFKIDELPQFFNVIRGDMSIVGPRPEVPEYAESLSGEDRIILSVRPGITGPATIKYRSVERLLAEKRDPERYSRDVIWRDKININKLYVTNCTLATDILIILRTSKEIGCIVAEGNFRTKGRLAARSRRAVNAR
jgi:lipopolysaccharide/colanic/teichoic acid biosynthesis glycosyltransferase